MRSANNGFHGGLFKNNKLKKKEKEKEGTLGPKAANWPPKFDGILFISLGPKGCKLASEIRWYPLLALGSLQGQ